MVKEAQKWIEIISKIISDRQDQDKISPAWIATEAMKSQHATRLQHEKPLIYIGCHLYLRQLARGICASTFEDQEGLAQHDLFPALQRRYPVARAAGSEEPQYVKLELMTEADVEYNVSRLRMEANAKQKHADALEAWARDNFKRKVG